MLLEYNHFLDDYFQLLCNNARSFLQGGRTNLRCMAYRALRWVWTFNCGQVPDNASPTPIFNTTSSITDLDIKHLEQQNTGSYRCEGYDGQDLIQAQTCDLKVQSGKLVWSNAIPNFIA